MPPQGPRSQWPQGESRAACGWRETLPPTTRRLPPFRLPSPPPTTAYLTHTPRGGWRHGHLPAATGRCTSISAAHPSHNGSPWGAFRGDFTVRPPRWQPSEKRSPESLGPSLPLRAAANAGDLDPRHAARLSSAQRSQGRASHWPWASWSSNQAFRPGFCFPWLSGVETHHWCLAMVTGSLRREGSSDGCHVCLTIPSLYCRCPSRRAIYSARPRNSIEGCPQPNECS